MGGGDTCYVTVTASGGPVQYSVSGTSGPISASGNGSLAAGETRGVQVRANRGWFCVGNKSGTVYFTSGTSAGVTYSC